MTLLHNKKALFDYEAIKKIEAGIELHGFEVKSIKNKHGSLQGSYIILSKGSVFLMKAQIPPYQTANTPKGYDPYRKRKLLLNKKEIAHLVGLEHQRGLTIVPISMYNKGNKIKVEIAVVRKKKKHDKREVIKKRDAEREMRRATK